jgi:hypothetical protein
VPNVGFVALAVGLAGRLGCPLPGSRRHGGRQNKGPESRSRESRVTWKMQARPNRDWEDSQTYCFFFFFFFSSSPSSSSSSTDGRLKRCCLRNLVRHLEEGMEFVNGSSATHFCRRVRQEDIHFRPSQQSYPLVELQHLQSRTSLRYRMAPTNSEDGIRRVHKCSKFAMHARYHHTKMPCVRRYALYTPAGELVNP